MIRDAEAMDRLKGSVAIVTGGASGIGRATACLFAAEGAAVSVGDIDAAGGQATVAEIEALGGQALFVRTDVSSASDADWLVAKTVERWGSLHVLHNNAFWARSGRTVLTLSEDDWDRTLDVSLATAERYWTYARLWLYAELTDHGHQE